jgi:hypothetical protein
MTEQSERPAQATLTDAELEQVTAAGGVKVDSGGANN